MERKSNENYPVNLPTDESIAKTIRELRIIAECSQADISTEINKTRAWMFQVEHNRIDPIYFYKYFVHLYGRELAIKTYGIDWDLYRSDRVALYYAYYDINRKTSCDILGCTFSTLTYNLNKPCKYIKSYQMGIDKVFPRIKEDQQMLSHFHLVGNNSMAEIDGKKAYITMNCARKRDLDTRENREALKKDIDYWMNYHKKNDGIPETGIIKLG